MTLTNREVFAVDPTERDIPNLGVAKVKSPEDESDWATLKWELSSFVCEGEYERGLERILDQFVSHVGQNEQPAVWVNGFYGSGKTHLMRVLEYLWHDYELPSGESARSLTRLTSDIEAHLTELSSLARRAGGLWSAAGTLGSGAAGSVRLAFLEIVFRAAGLPSGYSPARLALWLKQQNFYDAVCQSITDEGKEVEHEFRNLFVSDVLARALIGVGAKFGDSEAEVSKALRAQFTNDNELTNSETLDILEEVLRLNSDTEGKLPLTLIVLDEMSQYIDEDGDRALQVQDLVEGCSSRFDSQVLIVATGQLALTDTPTLSKLNDRFLVNVTLSDTDVETVVRQVILRKKPDKLDDIDAALSAVSGEVDKHLGGTRIAPTSADGKVLSTDYPLLPTRRRFWESALRHIDKAGKSGVLRTQLKIVHEAAQAVANEPLGTVIGADFVFKNESARMLQSGVLLKEIHELILTLDDGTSEGKLKSRAASLIFLITQIPHDGVGDIGVRATEPMIADLLVEDLATDGPYIRKELPGALESLVTDGRIMQIDDEYRLQTAEGAEWTQDFSRRRAAVSSDSARIATLRNDWLNKVVNDELSGLQILQGESNTPRRPNRHWETDAPPVDGDTIPVWIRSEWEVSESKVIDEAKAAGLEDPTVYILLSKTGAPAISDALAVNAAALEVGNQRPTPQTEEGRDAKLGMQSRAAAAERELAELFAATLTDAKVFQGGGNLVTGTSLREAVESACDKSLDKMFPKFDSADKAGWEKVIKKARDGAPDALLQIGFNKEAPGHPVCQEVLSRTSAGGTKGSDLHKDLAATPFGWFKDAVDGALLALMASGHVRAEQDGAPVASPKELPATQIGKATFFKDDDPPSMTEVLAVRGALKAAKVEFTNGDEKSAISGLIGQLEVLAESAGGAAPLPEVSRPAYIAELKKSSGNVQLRAAAKVSELIRDDVKTWSELSEIRSDREEQWNLATRLLAHTSDPEVNVSVTKQMDAIKSSRRLLETPDPAASLVDELTDHLRSQLTEVVDETIAAEQAAIAEVESADDWGKLSDAQQSSILASQNLKNSLAPEVATDGELLRALDGQSLQGWANRLQALGPKVKDALAAAAKELEPSAVRVKPAAATIRNESEADAYLNQLRADIVGHLGDGATVII